MLASFASSGAACAGLFGGAKRIAVTSEPAGAMVFLDDRYIGTTPATLPPGLTGKHLLKITRHGYVPVIEAIDLSGGRPLQFKLAIVPEGSLEVVSNPDGAEVWLDGELQGSTPITLDLLVPGEHQVRVLRGSYEPWSQTVTITGGKTITLRPTLQLREEEFYQKQMEEQPANSSFPLELAHILLIKGDRDGAAKYYERALDVYCSGKDVSPQSSRVFPELKKVYDVQFNYGDAKAIEQMRNKLREVFERMIAKYPKTPVLYQKLSRYYQHGGLVLKNAELFERMAEEIPGDVSAYEAAGEQFKTAGQLDRAIAILKKAVERHKGASHPYQLLGEVYSLKFQRGDAAAKPLAISAFREASRISPDPVVRNQIKRALESLGATAE